MRRNRSRFEIIETVLRLCKCPINKTNIIHRASLSWEQANQYLDALELKGLIRRNCEGFYQTTRFGCEFCEGLTTLLLLWDDKAIKRLVTRFVTA